MKTTKIKQTTASAILPKVVDKYATHKAVNKLLTTVNPLDEIKQLMTERNALIKASAYVDLSTEFSQTVDDLCDRLAFLSVKKALEFKQNNPTNMPSSALAVVDTILSRLFYDYSVFKFWKLDDILGDSIPLYDIAYMTAYEHLNKPINLDFDDIVYTKVKKNGSITEYNLYQYIKHIVHKDIREWSTTESADLKKMYYLLGYTDDGKQVTTRKRPSVDITDISTNQRKAFFRKYRLTSRQENIMLLHLNKRTTAEIAFDLSIDIRTVQREIKAVKHILSFENAYIKE